MMYVNSSSGKSFVISLITLFLFSSKVEAQDDFKFLPDDARMEEYLLGLPSSHGNGNGIRRFEYYVMGDTLIEDLPYQLLGTRNISYSGFYGTPSFQKIIDFGLFAALRKDDTKVYFRLLTKVSDEVVLGSSDSKGHWNHNVINSFPLDEDRLIYHFNMDSIGSNTWPGRINRTPVIDTIITFNGLKKLRYMFYDGRAVGDPTGSDFWVEDIGSSHGLLGNFGRISPGSIPTLDYICSEELIYYQFRARENCKQLTSIQEAFNGKADIDLVVIYPNPGKDQFYIQNKSRITIQRIIFLNVLGQVIQEISMSEMQNIDQKSSFALTRKLKSPGLYIVHLFMENETVITKQLVVK